jgi:hypothetical protein
MSEEETRTNYIEMLIRDGIDLSPAFARFGMAVPLSVLYRMICREEVPFDLIDVRMDYDQIRLVVYAFNTGWPRKKGIKRWAKWYIPCRVMNKIRVGGRRGRRHARRFNRRYENGRRDEST